MKTNYCLTITGKKVQLVPYRKKFVLRYHEWMKSPEMLELTASEPLSLQEEYEMQQTWRDDPNKCTFIVLTTGKSLLGQDSTLDEEKARMIGDVNLFLSVDNEGRQCAEIDIMIAEKAFHRSGCGREAVLLMIWYASTKLSIQCIFAKINESNLPSRTLFESLGFEQVNYVAAFQEYEYRYEVNKHMDSIQEVANDQNLQEYCEPDE